MSFHWWVRIHNSALTPVQPRGKIYNIHPTAPDPQTPQNDRTGPPKIRGGVSCMLGESGQFRPLPLIFLGPVQNGAVFHRTLSRITDRLQLNSHTQYNTVYTVPAQLAESQLAESQHPIPNPIPKPIPNSNPDPNPIPNPNI